MSEIPRSPSNGAGQALVPFMQPQATPSSLTFRRGLWAAGLALAFGVGALGVHTVQRAWAAPDPATVQAQTNARMLAQLEGEIGRLKGSVDTLRTAADGSRQDDSLRNLKHSVETLKAEIEQVRSNDGTTLSQISNKIDKVDHDPTQKLADIVARLDRIEHEPAAKVADAAPKVADLTNRLDRLEKQVAAPATTGTIPAATHGPAATTTSVPRTPVAAVAAKPDTYAAQNPDAKVPLVKPPTVDAWVVRDVYDGMALVEARRGGLREVEPGAFLPGAGQVRSIERRGRGWVVLTSRGVIETSTF